jgi:L-alanine-DL-glutamate epimerase-like enolase superfamily enzyme
MDDLAISRIDVHVVGPNTPRVAWAGDLTPMYQANTIVRLRSQGGLEGIGASFSYTEFDYNCALAEAMRPLLPHVLGKTCLMRGELWQFLYTRRLALALQAMSAIDIALWDMAAKLSGLPLYQLLGGARDKILSYGSTPIYDRPEEYVSLCHELKDQGFTAVKIHPWCEIERDLEIVDQLQHGAGELGLALMWDADGAYSFTEALRMAERLERYDYAWFEAPLPDPDLDGYRELRRRTTVPIINGGNTVIEPLLLNHAIKMGCWTSARIDATNCGGITAARRVMAMAKAQDMTVEVQSWGYTLQQAANLHIMLAHDNCRYFEQAVPYETYEVGSLDVIRTDAEGYVHAPEGPGLGIRVDWDAVESASVMKIEYDAAGERISTPRS